MVRKMAYAGFSYLLGLFFASFFFFEVNVTVGICIMLVGGILCFFIKNKNFTVPVCCICFSIGCIFYALFDCYVYDNTVKYNGCTVQIDGVISDYKDYARDRSSYTIKGTINGELKAKILCYGEAVECNIGDSISVKGKAVTPKETYLFNSKAYYKSKGIYLVVNSADELTVKAGNGLPIKRALCSYRDFIYNKIRKYLSLDESAVVKAMLFGDKSGIDDTTKTLLYRAGIGHMMAVSGVHLAVVCSLIWFILCMFNMSKYLRFGILMIFNAAFVILAGMSNSVIRAAVMLFLVYGANLFDRRSDLMNSLGIAVILLTVGNPFVVRDASFVLSVTGVIGIGGIAPVITKMIEDKQGKPLKKYIKSLIASCCVSAVIFPASFMFFDEISIVSPISNLILIPFCTVILVCGVLTAISGGILAFPLMKAAGVCCNIVLIISKWIGSFKLAYIPLGYDFIGLIIVIALIVIVVTALLTQNMNQTVLSAVFIFSVCVAVTSVYKFVPSDHISVAVLNNGRGSSSVVIHDKKSAAVIDLNKGGKTADYVIKYLSRLGTDRIDISALMVDHNFSEAIYKRDYELFDVGTVFIPLGEYNQDYKASYGSATEIIDIKRTAIVDMPEYKIKFNSNNTIELYINGCSILIYDGKTDVNGAYSVVVNYSATGNDEDIYGDILVFTDSGAVAEKTSDNYVYIGENVQLNIYDKKIRTEVISNGIGY